MSDKNKTKQKTDTNPQDHSKLRTVLGDLFALLCTLAVGAYIIILIQQEKGIWWLNYAKLAVTAVFALLYLIKLFILNGLKSSPVISRRIKIAYKIIKYILKLVMLAVIIASLTEVILSDGFTTAVIIGTVISNIFFFIFFIFDTCWLIHARRKAREVKKQP